jgi:hypothetical protein
VARGASEDDAPRWGWSHLQVTPETREALRVAFLRDVPVVRAKSAR